MNFLVQRNSIIYIVAAIISLLLSLDASVRGTVINPDAICYLQSAESLNVIKLHDMMQLCGQAQWPFFSVLIFSLAKLTHLSYFASAFFLDGFFSLIAVLSFIYIINLFTKEQSILWLAAATILFAHEFNSVREYIIRDHGFWAFYLASIACLIQYCRNPKWQYALLWSFMLCIATLFRIEGAVFLLFLPIIAWLRLDVPLTTRLKMFLQMNALVILAGFALSLLLIVYPHTQKFDLSRLTEVKFHLTHGIATLIQNFQKSADALGQHVLSSFAARDAHLILFLMLSTWFVVSVIFNVSFIYAVLAVFAWYKNLAPWSFKDKLVVYAYLLVNVLITAAFLVDNMFLSKRYLIALSLVLMLWVPFALNYFYERRNQRKGLLIVLALCIFASGLGGVFDFGYSKTYIKYAGIWMRDHVAKDARVYSNDPQVMYYSQHFGNEIFKKAVEYRDPAMIDQGKWKNYDYVALHLHAKDKESNAHYTNEINLTPSHVFANKRGDQVIIYQIEH